MESEALTKIKGIIRERSFLILGTIERRIFGRGMKLFSIFIWG